MPSINAYNKYNKYLKSRNISSPKKATVEKVSNVKCTPCHHVNIYHFHLLFDTEWLVTNVHAHE